jgi:superfamily II DNA or RNA helicase
MVMSPVARSPLAEVEQNKPVFAPHLLELLQLVSLAYVPITKGQLLQCLESAQCRDAEGLPWVLASINPVVESLVAEGALVAQGPRITCEPTLAEQLARQLALTARCTTMVEAIRTVFKTADYRYGYFVRQFGEGVRDLRLALYAGRFDDFTRLAQTIQSYFSAEWRSKNPYVAIFDNPFQPEQFDSLPPEISLPVAATLLMVRLNRMESCSGPMSWLWDRAKTARDEQKGWFATVLCEPMVMRGHIDDAVLLSRGKSGNATTPIAGLACVLRGQMEEGLKIFEAILKDGKKVQDLRKAGMAGLSGVAYVIALISTGDPKRLEKASSHIAAVIKGGSSMLSVFACLGHVSRATQSVDVLASEDRTETSDRDPLGTLFRALASWWVDGAGERIDRDRLRDLAAKAESQGYRWIAAEALGLLGRMDNPTSAERAEKLHYELGTVTLAEAIRRQPLWERALGALDRLGNEFSSTTPPPRNVRFAWYLTHIPETGQCLIEAREQRRTQGNAWGQGKAVTINRMLTAQQDLEGLTEQDRAVIAMLRHADIAKKGSEKRIDSMPALALLIDHPLLFWAQNPDQPVQLVRGQPEIVVQRERNQLRLAMTPVLPEESRYFLMRETRNRLRMIEMTTDQERALGVIGRDGLVLPKSAEERLTKSIEGLNLRFRVRSDIGGGNTEIVPADPQIYALLSPSPTGLQVELMVYPEGDRGEAYTPGAGQECVGYAAPDEPVQRESLRQLRQERTAADRIFEICRPWIKPSEYDYHGHSINPATACELLLALRELGDDVKLRWPEGETLKIRGEVDASQLSLQVSSQGDWLGVSGSLTVDSNTVVELKALLEAASTPGTRFVALKDGQYLALSEQLLKRVRELGGLSEQHADLLRIHALAASQLSSVVDEVTETHSDPGWRALLERREALSVWQPELPEGLKAELRDYQKVGFEWLARHAHSGAGACLADDMGLGKTLQTLALLLHRASQGPALVVAPTSVCGNWDSEAKRFAPSLKIRWLGNGPRDRNFADAGPGELIIMSYTLFQQETEALATKEWATVVLDEAQAIKNSGTKRSQAAMKLKSRFRLITTGTPIENHLGELWNLFRFINPGLLGSLDSFTDRFAVPIEKNNDAEARERLRRLIQPFVLRRTKSQVLSELPPRTEVTLTLDMSPDERAMYEAVRQQALESVTVEGEDQPNRIRVLAGIMKLRRACCHGSLVIPDREWASGKVAALMEIVEELRESGHRALIFSQFVDYLEIIREAVSERGVSFHYLDGSTPSMERVRRVKAFQEGEGDLFLISLKAGGVGLNLTGADYVIHMDPWWNPAVEDQASDRAHRIGQTRPVTVYRLISRDTIEEKIVALHERKRHLADSLLEGAGETSAISTEELIGLLQEESGLASAAIKPATP